VTKIAAEHYVFTLGRLVGCQTVALRIFNAYGPGQRIPPAHAPVIPLFLKRALGGGSLVIHGSGHQTRDYVYIDDVIRALEATATAEDIDSQVINVGTGQETSVHDLVQEIAVLAGRETSVIHNPNQDGGVSRLVADTRRAQYLLGYRPRVSLREGLERLLNQDPQFQPARVPRLP
jgi:UDP-glucose 4-epimerase